VPTDPKFLDPDAISDPQLSDDESENGTMPRALPEPKAEQPCDDCTRYAQVGYVIGAAVGIVAGGVVAYVILRSKLAPVG
jgi:hypothetical protein